MGASEQALRDTIWNGAVNYAEKIARDPKDNTNKSNIRTAYLWDWIIIGPFNWTFPGDTLDPYSALTLYDQNGNVIDVKNFSNYGDERWNNTHTIYSGQDFYISVRQDSGVKAISKIKAKYNINNVYNARLTFMKPASGNEKQTILIIDSSTGQKPVEFTYTYNVNLTGNLKLQKKDADTEVPMNGVGFKFKNKDTGKWVVQNGNTFTYTADENSATTFYTVKGEINLKKMYVVKTKKVNLF